MQPMLTFPGVACALFTPWLLLSTQSAIAHQDGDRHDIAQTEASRHAGATRSDGEHADDGARLAATCTGCHGTNGNTVGDALPALAGQSKQALLASLMAFKSGERNATVMTQLARGYSDADLERIAAFFAAQKASAAADAPRPSAGRSKAEQPVRTRPVAEPPEWSAAGS